MAEKFAGARHGRLLEDLARWPLLDDPPAIEDDDPVADPLGEIHLMGDDDHGHALVGERLHDAEHLADRLGVERRGRLVEQHDVGLHRQRPGDRDALLLAARQRRRVLPRLVGEPDLAQQLGSAGLRRAARHAEHGERTDRDVAQNREMGEELEILEHHPHALAQLAHVALLVLQIDAVEDDAAAIDRLQHVGAPQQRRFSRAARPDETDDLAAVDLEGDAGERLEGAVALDHVGEGQHRRRRAADAASLCRGAFAGHSVTLSLRCTQSASLACG